MDDFASTFRHKGLEISICSNKIKRSFAGSTLPRATIGTELWSGETEQEIDGPNRLFDYHPFTAT